VAAQDADLVGIAFSDEYCPAIAQRLPAGGEHGRRIGRSRLAGQSEAGEDEEWQDMAQKACWHAAFYPWSAGIQPAKSRLPEVRRQRVDEALAEPTAVYFRKA